METKHYFYVLLCKDGSFYGGYTTDPKRRVTEHNSGTGAKYTRAPARRPVQMIHLESFDTRKEATQAEYAFKKLTKAKKISYLKKNKPACTIRSFKPEDAEAVSRLLKRNFLEINSQFYPMEQMELLVEKYSAQAVIKQASCAHTYVAELGDTLIGTATICPYFNSLTESIILSVFILPEYQQNGIGTSLLKRLKTDPFYIRASRIEVLASRNAQNFYSGFGFKIKNPAASENTQGYVVMEKHRKK